MLFIYCTNVSTLFVSRLIKVWLSVQDERLNSDQDGEETRCLRVPLFFGTAVPRVEDTETNLPIRVQVWVETDSLSSVRF